jgi:alpha-mannosidase
LHHPFNNNYQHLIVIMKKKFLLLFVAAFAVCGISSAQENSAKKYTAYMVADAHLDTQWNWDVQTTIKNYVWNTLYQNLYLLKTYPHYVFNFEGGIKYAWMKEYYPTQYQELKKYITNGRWHLAGSSWDANETVICSPEAWIRNILLGQTFYRSEFGTEGTDIFLPDCFGFGYDLPTLAAHCSLIGFSTQKLGWRSHAFFPDGRRYPFTIGLWKGIDGSAIMLTHGFGYGDRWKDEDLSQSKTLLKEIGEGSLGKVYRYYGTGDMGGSPDLASVRSIEKGIKGDGPIRIISATSDQLYKDYLPYDKHPELPVFDGELTMDVHGTGCYTSQAAMKYYNRQNELLGDAAERAAVTADWLGTTAYPTKTMTESWRRFIWNQFHDDITGTSIPRAYEFAWNDELLSLKQFAQVLTSSVNGIASRLNTQVSGTPVILYNTEAFNMNDIASITLPEMKGSYKVTDAKGKEVTSQVVTDTKGKPHLLVDASVPATGYAVYSVKAGSKNASRNSVNGNSIENSVYKVTVDAKGDVSSIVDKRCQKELVASGKSIRLVVFNDCKSYSWPAWEILKETIDKTPVGIDEKVSVKLIDNGPLCKSLLISKSYGKTSINQYIRLYEGSRADRIDFCNEVDWQSMNSLLKAEFPLSVSNEKATYDLGLGSIQRGNNKETAYEVYSHEWADLTSGDDSYGVTILNNCKYGWDKPDNNTLRMSLLYTPKTDRGFSYQSRQDLGYHTFTYSIVGHSGALDKSAAVDKAAILNNPIRAFVSPKHNGDLGREFSFVSSDNRNVIVRALKKAEVSDEYVVRVYENAGKSEQTAHLTFAGTIEKAVEADGTEKEIAPATFAGNKLDVTIKPFSVKTYKIVLKGESKKTIDTQSIELPFDRKCFSFNEFRGEGNFEGGYTYAAELLPDEGITLDNIPFKFGEKDAANGVTCKGNVIKLPAGNKYNRIYFLAASTSSDQAAAFTLGKVTKEVNVPYYTGFIGQWGHEGHTKGFLKDAEVAYVGTHRHSGQGDKPYEFTYMFKFGFQIAKGITEIKLPDNDKVVIFSATLASEGNSVETATPLFGTNNKDNGANSKTVEKTNLLKGAKIIACSGHVNEKEAAENTIDGDETTKWCDTSASPNYVDYDLGEAKTVSAWKVVNAGSEDDSYVTRSCLLQGRNTPTEEWKTLDMFEDNHDNVVEHSFNAVTVRYVRLYVISPTQERTGGAARIYELKLY